MPPRLIMSRQFATHKGEQFTPELIWQSMVFKVDFPCELD